MKFVLKRSAPARVGYSYDPRRDGVSQSIIATWLECREKSRLNTLRGLTPLHASKPLSFGSLSHSVLASYYRGMKEDRRPLKSALEDFDDWVQDGVQEWQAEHPRRRPEDEEMIEEYAAILGVLHPRYFKKWRAKDEKMRILKVEEKFSVPLKMKDGAIVPLVGKFDMVFKDENNHLVLKETKNKSRFGDAQIDKLPMDLQLATYLVAMETANDQPDRGLYDVIRRPGEKRKQDESLSDFADRLAKNIDKDPDHYFARFTVTFTPRERDEQRFRIERLVQEFYSWWKTEDHSTRDLLWNGGACDVFGPCQNLQVCANGDETGHRVRALVSPELA